MPVRRCETLLAGATAAVWRSWQAAEAVAYRRRAAWPRMRAGSGGCGRRRHDGSGAGQRRHIVRAFQLDRERKAPDEGRRSCRIGCARARHPDRARVPPQRSRQQAGSAGPGLARRHRRRRQPALSHGEPAQGAGRRKGRCPLHHHPRRARLLFRGTDLAVQRSGRSTGAGAGGRERSAREPAGPPAAHGRARRRRSDGFEAPGRGAVRHDRRQRRRRQDHRRGRGRARSDRCLRRRRALRRSRHARSRPI